MKKDYDFSKAKRNPYIQEQQLRQMDQAIETGLKQLAEGNKITAKKSYVHLKKKIQQIASKKKHNQK